MLATAELIEEVAQKRRLADALPGYLQQTPLYQAWLKPAAEVLTDSASWECELARLPFITKQDIARDFPRNFLVEPAELDALLEDELVELEHTSGTSQPRLPLLLPHGWWNLQEERALRLNPFIDEVLASGGGSRRVTIASPVCSGELCYTGVPSRSERAVGNTLFASLSRFPFLWSETDLERIAAETLEWAPDFLDVDPVYGVVFALYCKRRGIRLPSLKFIVCTYEFPSVIHRRNLQRVFGVPVINLYGATETGHLLVEMPDGYMRASLETAFFEVIHTDNLGIGELVVTTLTNPHMPLVRYRIGDLVEKIDLPYGTRYRVHGRLLDAFVAGSGRRITTWEIDQCFLGCDGIAHYQLLQRSEERWLLRLIPDGPGPSTTALNQLRDRLLAVLEIKGQLAIEPTDCLMAESSGKFRLGYPLTKEK